MPLAVLALVLTALYERTDNLLAPITAHALFNALNFATLLVIAANLRRMNEFELIHRLTRSLPTNPSVVVGAGDDCAVLDAGVPDRLLLFKTDAVVEGVHFTSDDGAGEDRPQGAGPVLERHCGHGGHAHRRARDHRPAARLQPRASWRPSTPA